jgi:hypothetical protein
MRNLRFRLLLWSILFLSPCLAIGQAGNADQYIFSTSTAAALDPMTGSNNALGAGIDDVPSTVLSIGFNFSFEGINYTQFSVSPDGFLKLGGTASTSQFNNNTSATVNIPKLYPHWDDLATGSDGWVKYLVSSSAPNRILKVEWFLTVPRNAGGNANTKFQCWLYESTNVIEFRYGGTPAGNANSMSAGIRGAQNSATAGQFKFIDVTTSAHTASNTVVNDANTAYPGPGRMYRFTPPPPCAGMPTAGAISGTGTACADWVISGRPQQQPEDLMRP